MYTYPRKNCMILVILNAFAEVKRLERGQCRVRDNNTERQQEV